MTVTGFSPLGNGKSYSKLGFQDISCLEDSIIMKISHKLKVSAAQEPNIKKDRRKLIKNAFLFTGSVKVGFGERSQLGN